MKQPANKLGIAIFARTPDFPGKSRLAATIGERQVEIFYRHCLDCVRAWMKDAEHLSVPYWALTGAGERSLPLWQGFPIIEQGSGGLAARMYRCADALAQKHPYWCLTGTDIPHMPHLSSLKLAERLENHDFVFGPSTDGGFWLIAGRKTIPEQAWAATPYSQSDTLENLMAAIKREYTDVSVDSTIPEMTDIDSEPDLKILLEKLGNNRSVITYEQKLLLDWVSTLLPRTVQ